MPKRISMQETGAEWTSVRIRKSTMARAVRAGELLSGTGASYVVERAVEDLLNMADAAPGERKVPMVVRLLDAARAEGAPLPEDAGSVPRRGAVRVGQG